jgi:hypothetical protein
VPISRLYEVGMLARLPLVASVANDERWAVCTSATFIPHSLTICFPHHFTTYHKSLFTLSVGKMDSLDFPLSSKTKQSILDIIFDYNSDGDIDPAVYIPSDGYFSFYTRIVEGCPARVTPETHQDIANLVNLLKRPESTRNSVQDILRSKFLGHQPEDRDEILESWISLATRLLLMVPTRRLLTTGRAITVSGETKLDWKDGNIKDLVNKQFISQTAMKDTVKLEKIFNARNLERIAGLEVRWTSNLADHLRMRDDDTAVEIFHYASFLRFHQTW